MAEQIIPEGIEPPAEIPSEIFNAALSTFLGRQRVDMRALAGELGIGRATLYRKVDGRDHLLGEVVWCLTRRLMVKALQGAEDLLGPELLLTVMARFMRDVHASPDLRRFLEAEPECALRILTSKQGLIQPGMIDTVQRLLEFVAQRDSFVPQLDQVTLAYAIVRIGESFLYADVIADNEPDVERAGQVMARLLG